MKRGERLKLRRKELNYTLRAAADKLGISTAGVQNLERDETMPNLELGLKIAELYKKSILWVLNGTEEAFDRIPVIGNTQAGPDKVWFDNLYPDNFSHEYVNLPAKGKHIYGLRVVGDSMKGVYAEGDIVLVDPDSPPIFGEDVIVKTENDVMVKRLARIVDKKVYLDSSNTAFDRIIKNLEEIELMHPVIGSVKSFMVEHY